MNVLVFGTSYLKDSTDLWVFRQWLNINRTLNPDAHLLVVDSASPVSPEIADFPREDHEQLIQLGDNIGHLSKTGRDGWGRAFCNGLMHGYGAEWVIHMETDLLFARPVNATLDRMEHDDSFGGRGVKVCCPWALPYPFIETALMFFDGRWLRNTGLAQAYDWENGRGLPEIRVEKLIGDDLWIAPFRGLRMDLRDQQLPQPLDWVTHATVAQYRQFLRQNGIPEV